MQTATPPKTRAPKRPCPCCLYNAALPQLNAMLLQLFERNREVERLYLDPAIPFQEARDALSQECDWYMAIMQLVEEMDRLEADCEACTGGC